MFKVSLFVALFSLIVAQSPNNGCLLFHSSSQPGELNLSTWEFIPVPRSSLDEAFAAGSVVSPDGTHVAAFGKAATSKEPVPVSIVRLTPPFDSQGWDVQTFYFDSSITATWSADGVLLAFVASGPDNTMYVGVASVDGKIHLEKRLDVLAGARIAFDSWSADGKFFALIETNGSDVGAETYSLTFWSAADLSMVKTLDGSLSDLACPDTYASGPNVRCLSWSATGHTVAYVLDNNNRPRLVITTLDGTSRIIPLSVHSSWRYEWYLMTSPNGNYVALMKDGWLPSNDSSQVQSEILLNLYGFDGTTLVNIDPNAAFSSVFRVDGPEVTQWAWTLDSKSLLYVRTRPSDKGTFEAIRYIISSRVQIPIFSIPSEDSEMTFNLAKDGRSVMITAGRNLNYGNRTYATYLVSLDGDWSRQLSSNDLFWSAWSADGSQLAIYTVDDVSTPTQSRVYIYRSDGMKLLDRAGPLVKLINGIEWTQCSSF